MSERLEPLPGTAAAGSWRMQNADEVVSDGRLATFAILRRPKVDSCALIGTGFYLQGMGGFATAAHVALEAERHSEDLQSALFPGLHAELQHIGFYFWSLLPIPQSYGE